MKYNDLSNRGCPVIALRVEDTLIDIKKSSNILESFMNRLSPFLNATVNKSAYKTIMHLFRNTDYTVDLIVDKKYLKDRHLLNIINNMPYNNLVGIKNNTEIEGKILNEEYLYYVDNNYTSTNLPIYKTKGVVSLNSLNNMLGI